ncbi:early nodulin-like protein 1 [Impatiens glandulifera]|uniref:early nodulin-like protein 1 n=1 Tax=Impatiens glandulifera TaxID=253017 RepID=UPI001FB0A4D7|nr:early nodulin-like protein 1 [Impatiens glandulifera]
MGGTKIHLALSIIVFSLLIGNGSTYEFKVGGSVGWTVPADSNPVDYKHWAEKNRFQIGDTLLFTYGGSNDSVLYVTKEDYDNCTTSNPIDTFTNGYSVFKFQHSGHYYFISGNKDNCLKNEKIEVIVLADRNNKSAPPSPAPVGEKSPSPPPNRSSEDDNPSPAPNVQQDIPTSNTASSTVMSSMGAFIIGSYVIVSFV